MPRTRTQGASGERHLSDQIQLSFATGPFNRWRAKFRNMLDFWELSTAWQRLVRSGCAIRDLEWALYNAIDHADSGCDVVRQNNEFVRAKKALISDVRRLREDFQGMTKVQFGGQPAWTAALGWLPLRTVPPVLSSLPKILEQLERLVTLMYLLPRGARAKAIQSGTASGGEIFLQMYVEGYTGKPYLKEISILLEAAAEAYGLENERRFTHEAMTRRLRRYRKTKASTYAENRTWIGEFRNLRENDPRLELHSFFITKTVEKGFPKVGETFLKQASDDGALDSASSESPSRNLGSPRARSLGSRSDAVIPLQHS